MVGVRAEVGSHVANYRIEAPLGEGGMASVWRAVDEQLGRQVALKVLRPELSQDDSFRLRFIRESRAAAAVDHPNIIPIFAAGESDGLLYIAMRYVSGGDVQSLLALSGPLPPERVMDIVIPVASALDKAHAAAAWPRIAGQRGAEDIQCVLGDVVDARRVSTRGCEMQVQGDRPGHRVAAVALHLVHHLSLEVDRGAPSPATFTLRFAIDLHDQPSCTPGKPENVLEILRDVPGHAACHLSSHPL